MFSRDDDSYNGNEVRFIYYMLHILFDQDPSDRDVIVKAFKLVLNNIILIDEDKVKIRNKINKHMIYKGDISLRNHFFNMLNDC